MEEEGDVVGGFFDEGIGDYGNHGREDGFLEVVLEMRMFREGSGLERGGSKGVKQRERR